MIILMTITRGRMMVINPADINFFKVNNRNTRTMCKICSQLTIKTAKRRHSGVSTVNFEQISLIVLVFPLLTLNK